MNDAALQILPYRRDPFVVASQISPAGMTLAGQIRHRHHFARSMSTQG